MSLCPKAGIFSYLFPRIYVMACALSNENSWIFQQENVWLQCTNKCLLLFLPSCQFAKFILLQQSIFLRSVKALLVAPFTFQLLLLHPYLLSIFLPHNWVRKMKRHLSFSDVQLLSCRIITGMCPKGRWRQKNAHLLPQISSPCLVFAIQPSF